MRREAQRGVVDHLHVLSRGVQGTPVRPLREPGVRLVPLVDLRRPQSLFEMVPKPVTDGEEFLRPCIPNRSGLVPAITLLLARSRRTRFPIAVGGRHVTPEQIAHAALVFLNARCEIHLLVIRQTGDVLDRFQYATTINSDGGVAGIGLLDVRIQPILTAFTNERLLDGFGGGMSQRIDQARQTHQSPALRSGPTIIHHVDPSRMAGEFIFTESAADHFAAVIRMPVDANLSHLLGQRREPALVLAENEGDGLFLGSSQRHGLNDVAQLENAAVPTASGDAAHVQIGELPPAMISYARYALQLSLRQDGLDFQKQLIIKPGHLLPEEFQLVNEGFFHICQLRKGRTIARKNGQPGRDFLVAQRLIAFLVLHVKIQHRHPLLETEIQPIGVLLEIFHLDRGLEQIVLRPLGGGLSARD